MTNKIQKRIALVTGASSGIGAKVATDMAKSGILTILTARNAEKLAQIEKEITEQGYQAVSFPADLNSEKERIRLIDRINNQFGRLDILINSAGSGWYGYGYNMNWQECRDMMILNMESLVHLTILVLKGMHTRGTGHIINISSIAGSLPITGIAVYSASKAFVDNYSMALYREMRGTGVHISVIKPAAVQTPFFKTAAARENGFPIPAGKGMPAAVVSRRILSLLRRPRKRSIMPVFMGILPLLEIAFGWFIDLLGPALLKKAEKMTGVK